MLLPLGLYKAFYIQCDCFCGTQECASERYGSGWEPGRILRVATEQGDYMA